MNEFLKKGIIGFLSIILASLILLYYADYSLVLIFQPILLAFILFCTVIAVIISRWFADIWGNALSVFIAVMLAGFIWSWFSILTVLFVIMAIPSAIFSLVIWKLWDMAPATQSAPMQRRVTKRVVRKRSKRYKRKR